MSVDFFMFYYFSFLLFFFLCFDLLDVVNDPVHRQAGGLPAGWTADIRMKKLADAGRFSGKPVSTGVKFFQHGYRELEQNYEYHRA